MLKTIRVIALGFIFVYLGGCAKKPESLGGETKLFVVADSSDWAYLEAAFKNVFEKTMHTPQPEKVFEVHWVPPDRFNEVATRKNLVLLGALNSPGELTPKIKNMLSQEVRERVEAGSEFVFTKKDPWAKQQLLVVLVSNDLPELREKLEGNKEFLYNLFEEKLIAETTEDMFEMLEQKELEKELLKKYGWTIRIQHDYFINSESPIDRFVMLRRSLPSSERWIFVHWIDGADANIINEEWAIQTRNRLAGKFYENDKVNEEYTYSKEVDFLGRPALMLEGLWENNEKVIGGPFRSYSFYDEPSGRIYMIDIAVFYPAGDKEPFLRQLDIMAHSFKTSYEIKEDATKEGS
jgi:hypothetical protein